MRAPASGGLHVSAGVEMGAADSDHARMDD
jgi:hypothetical protein